MKYLFLAAIIFLSCNELALIKKTYSYSEDGKSAEVINAYTDSAAYLEAYQKFIITKKVYQNMKSTGGVVSREPQSFMLTDSKGNVISESIFSSNIDSLKKDIYKRIFDMPNLVEATLTQIREEKHGEGAKYDTGGLYLAPVKVLSAKFVSKEYSSYKDIALRYKNVSQKVITAIRFKWYGKNAFDEPADVGGYNGWGGGFRDEPLSPGATDYSEWSISSRDGKKILIAYPYEVVFEDGTKWLLEK
jgi:hypothetical protein